MERNKTYNRKKIVWMFFICFFLSLFLVGRLVYLMVFCSEYYGKKATDLHQRGRVIKAARGRIVDATGNVLAGNRTVCTISVIYNQVKDRERVIEVLTKELDLPEEKVRARVEKRSSIEKIKANVPKAVGDRVRAYKLDGVKIDEDYKRYYTYDTLASKVLGFTGGENQGIVGLEVHYDSYLQGKNGEILTLTDARGVEIEGAGETRRDPVNGDDLYISLDYNIQMYAQQTAEKVMEKKQADSVSIIVMNPKNGEIMAMVNVPEFNLNDPYLLSDGKANNLNEKEKQEQLNQMWRNPCLNDTYEPGSTFKVITAAAALEEGVVSLNDNFSCPGYKIVEDRRIRCHKTTGHGAETFTQAIENSCNPVFIELGLRLGVDRFYHYFKQFDLLKKTNIDLPGEAATIMHNPKKMGQVELATVSFGQSFQITPIQLATTISSIINGGTRITPHFGRETRNAKGVCTHTFTYDTQKNIVSEQTSATMRGLLEKVVSEGGGKKAIIEGYSIGGKTATSQTLPRSAHRYISSFVGFAPANDPQVLALAVIRNPQGIYYGGTIAAPVVREIFENILPYLNIPRQR